VSWRRQRWVLCNVCLWRYWQLSNHFLFLEGLGDSTSVFKTAYSVASRTVWIDLQWPNESAKSKYQLSKQQSGKLCITFTFHYLLLLHWNSFFDQSSIHETCDQAETFHLIFYRWVSHRTQISLLLMMNQNNQVTIMVAEVTPMEQLFPQKKQMHLEQLLVATVLQKIMHLSECTTFLIR